MSTSKTKLEKIQDIINRANLSTTSVKWWEKEMDDTMSQISKWELSDDSRADSEINKLKKKLESLIPRAQMEIEVINKLEKELDAIQKEIDEEAKSKNNKKGKRKKGI